MDAHTPRQSRIPQPGAPSSKPQKSEVPAAASHSPTRRSQLKQPTVSAKLGLELETSGTSIPTTALAETTQHRSIPSGPAAMTGANEKLFELEEKILQLTRDLSAAKAENATLSRQVERCNQQLKEQKEAHQADEESQRRRHETQLIELNKEIGELRFNRSELEFARGRLEDDLAKAKQELMKLKMQTGQNESTSLGLEDEVRLLRNRLRLAEERLQQERGEKATVLAESEVRLTSDNCSLEATNRELERALKNERENTQHAEERSKALREQIRKLNQQLATRPIAYELLALSEVDEEQQFAIEKSILETKWSELPDNIKVNCEDVKTILAQFAKDENIPLEKYDSTQECLIEVTKCLWYRQQLLIKRLNSVTLAMQASSLGLSLEELPKAIADHEHKVKKHEDVVSDLRERLSNAAETRNNMEIMFTCKLNSVKMENADLEVKNKQLSEAIESMNMELEELKKTIIGLRASHENAAQQETAEPSKIDLTQAIEVARLNEELKQARKNEAEKQQFVTQLRQQLIDLQTEFNRQKQENSAMHHKLKEKESTAPQDDLLSMEEQGPKIAAEKRVLEEEVSYWKERSKELTRENERLAQNQEQTGALITKEEMETLLNANALLEEECTRARVSKEAMENLLRQNLELQETEKRMNDVCRDLMAQIDNFANKESQEADQLGRKLAEAIESLSKAVTMSEPDFFKFVQSLAEENAKLIRETFELRAESVKLATKCAQLDADLQETIERAENLGRDHGILTEINRQQHQVLDQFEEKVKKLATESGQPMIASYSTLMEVLKERHRVQTEELATVQQRLELLEKDNALFLERMKQLDAANDSKIKNQLDTVLKQLDKLSTDRFDLQSKVLELKQQNFDLSRAAISSSKAGAQLAEMRRSLENLQEQSTNGGDDADGRLVHAEANNVTARPTQLKRLQPVITIQSVNASTSTEDLLMTRSALVSTADLFDIRNISTSTSDSIFLALLSANSVSQETQTDKETSNASGKPGKRMSVEHHEDSESESLHGESQVDDDIDVAIREDVVRKRAPAKVMAANQAHAQHSDSRASKVDASVQVWNEDEMKVKYDEATQKIAAELEMKQALLEQLRAKEETERNLLAKLSRIPQLESECAMLLDTIKLAESDKARLQSTLDDVRDRLESVRQANIEAGSKYEEERRNLTAQLAELQDQLQSVVKNAEATKQLLEAELDFKDRQLRNKLSENDLSKKCVEDITQELDNVKQAHAALEAELLKTSKLLDEANGNQARLRAEILHAAARPRTPLDETDESGAAEKYKSGSSRQKPLTILDQSETIQVLKTKLNELERELRKEKRLHQISKDHCRSVEDENEDLRKTLATKRRSNNVARETIDFNGKTKHDVVNELIMQSQAHARKLLETVHAGMSDAHKFRDGDGIQTGMSATVPSALENGSSYDMLQATL